MCSSEVAVDAKPRRRESGGELGPPVIAATPRDSFESVLNDPRPQHSFPSNLTASPS